MIETILLCGFGYLACSSIAKGAKEIEESCNSLAESTDALSKTLEKSEIIIRIETTIYDPDPERVPIEEIPEIEIPKRPDLRIVS